MGLVEDTINGLDEPPKGFMSYNVHLPKHTGDFVYYLYCLVDGSSRL